MLVYVGADVHIPALKGFDHTLMCSSWHITRGKRLAKGHAGPPVAFPGGPILIGSLRLVVCVDEDPGCNGGSTLLHFNVWYLRCLIWDLNETQSGGL
jgi:hypothetical protein